VTFANGKAKSRDLIFDARSFDL